MAASDCRLRSMLTTFPVSVHLGLVPSQRGWLLQHSFKILSQKFGNISQYPKLCLIKYYDPFFNITIFLRFYLFIFRQQESEGEKKGEKHQCVVASHAPPTGGLARNPGICPGWELNWRPFGLQAGAQSTEPHQPGQ